MAQYKSFVI